MRGFTLVEVVVAMALVALAGVGLVRLVELSGGAVRDARIDTMQTLAAESKMAELRAASALAFGGSVDSRLPGYSDFVTADGALAGTGPTAPRSAAYIRLWMVSPAPLDPSNTAVLQVVATRVGRPAARGVHLVSLSARVNR